VKGYERSPKNVSSWGLDRAKTSEASLGGKGQRGSAEANEGASAVGIKTLKA